MSESLYEEARDIDQQQHDEGCDVAPITDWVTCPEGSGSLGHGRCSVCGKPWVWNVWRRLYVAVCECHK